MNHRQAQLSQFGRNLFVVVIAAGFLSETEGQTLPNGKPFPAVQIATKARGEDIITALGGSLPEVAAWYGKSPDELRSIVSRDRSIWADRNGRLHYVCEAVPAEGAVAAEGSVFAEGVVPAEQTFFLHSRPSSPRKLYLDFNGNVTSGTAWNSGYAGGRDIVTPPFDIDGNPSAFSAAELDRIQYIWQRVAEDYAPFDVDVTTEDPGVEGLRKSSSSDVNFGTRVCIGGSSYDWYGANAGGVAYIGSFGGGSDVPCFVFSTQMAGGDEKFTADGISHEAGHTLGLHHDGTSSTAYYTGHNNWAPIMGVGYYAEMVQWSKGEYSGANNQEDDVAIIASRTGYITDSYGDDMTTATFLAGSNISVDGIIGRSFDLDLFYFNTAAGTVSLTLTAGPRGPNLDAMLALYDGNGSLLASANPTGPNAALTLFLQAGTYYVSVNGEGTGSPTTGYSAYGSLGQYRLTGTVNSSGAVPPVAVASAGSTTGTVPLTVQFSGSGSYDADGSIIAYDWNFGDGTTSTAANPSHIYNAAGSFLATLVVRDNAGLSSPVASVAIVVNAVPNQLPVAVTSVSVASGIAPLTVNFTGSGSYDPDGSIASYWWNFGDGTTSTAANPSHVYSNPGTYVAVLTVTDNLGGQNSRSTTITVSPNPNSFIYVQSMTMSLSTVSSGASARVAIKVVDPTGAPRAGVTVSGDWSGLASGGATGTTDANGVVTLTSKKVRKRGTFTFTTTSLSLSGYTYDASRNLISTASVTY